MACRANKYADEIGLNKMRISIQTLLSITFFLGVSISVYVHLWPLQSEPSLEIDDARMALVSLVRDHEKEFPIFFLESSFKLTPEEIESSEVAFDSETGIHQISCVEINLSSQTFVVHGQINHEFAKRLYTWEGWIYRVGDRWVADIFNPVDIGAIRRGFEFDIPALEGMAEEDLREFLGRLLGNAPPC